jgi:hypothetical protein
MQAQGGQVYLEVRLEDVLDGSGVGHHHVSVAAEW